MNTADEKFAMIALDLPGRVLPLPSTGRLRVADLLQLVGKARQLAGADEVAIPPASTAVADSVYVVLLRRRRR